MYDENLNENIIRWKKLIITRNNECKLSPNLKEKHRQFIDKPYKRDEIIKYCEELLTTSVNTPSIEESKIKIKTSKTKKINVSEKVVRDYQQECIDLIVNSKENVIISLPTGTGKNFIIVNSILMNKKYLILVPRIILMEQIQNELKEYNSKFAKQIQLIGDGNSSFDENKDITICVYNSVKIIEEHISKFHKIFIDEAHHINKPEIYNNEDEQDLENPARKDDEDDDDEYEDDEDDDEYDEQDLENPARKSDDESDSEEENKEDYDDEIKDKSTYIDIINKFTKLNNNVYLSATIDKQDGFKYYEKNIRDMINKKYLCDYTINIPVFTDDPTNKNICEYLLKEYRSIIIYCNTQKEGKQINDLLNELQKGSSNYIDCNTPKRKRNDIINAYKSGDLPFLVNVRILVEGFDAPITKGVCFMHLPSSKTTLIQIIGRALRLHDNKTIATIILPFSSKEDEASISNFMKVMAKNDSRIKKSYETRKLGGYINIDCIMKETDEDEKEGDDEDEEIEDKETINIKFKYDLIFDSMCVMKNSEEIWEKRLEEVKKYIDENGKRPSRYDKDKRIGTLCQWIIQQTFNYKRKQYNMKNEYIYNKWNAFINEEKYKQYFKVLIMYDNFIIKLNNVKKYIEKYNKRPHHCKNKNIKALAQWILIQIQNYNKKQENMKDEKIYNKWTEFINNEKYKIYFKSQEENFNINLEKVKKYIDENKKEPLPTSINKNIKILGYWIETQIRNYKKKQNNMKHENIYNKWTEFINSDKYKIYFQSQYEYFIMNLDEVKKYINEKQKRPSSCNNEKKIKFLGLWIAKNITNHNKKLQNMMDENIYKKWTEFINDENYKQYFQSQYDNFIMNLNKVKNYIGENKRRPSSESMDKNIKKLGNWIGTQTKNYNKIRETMKDENIYNKWTEFINDESYKQYFKSQYDYFVIIFNELKTYIDKYKKRPSCHDIDTNTRALGTWTINQIFNYKNNQQNMKDNNIYNIWSDFTNEPNYKKYFY
jgi:superfamily II DNA or RNA helicase